MDTGLDTGQHGGPHGGPGGRLLILGGTREAADLARAVNAGRAGDFDVITSLAGRLPTAPELPGRVRVGGFGGAAGLARFLAEAAISHVIDATHPFATIISRHAFEACDTAGVARLMLVRPAWQPADGDRWTEVDDFTEAAWTLPQLGRRAFLTIGPGELAAFTGVKDTWFLVRLFAPPTAALPLENYGVVVCCPPFGVDDELALLRRHRIDLLVTKNSGGSTEAKLAAARALGVPVLIVRRPPLQQGARVETVEEALAWLARAENAPVSPPLAAARDDGPRRIDGCR